MHLVVDVRLGAFTLSRLAVRDGSLNEEGNRLDTGEDVAEESYNLVAQEPILCLTLFFHAITHERDDQECESEEEEDGENAVCNSLKLLHLWAVYQGLSRLTHDLHLNESVSEYDAHVGDEEDGKELHAVIYIFHIIVGRLTAELLDQDA